MKLSRKIWIRAALTATGLVVAGTAHAQPRVCEHLGRYTFVDGRYVCSGDYAVGTCTWTDDCRVNVE